MPGPSDKPRSPKIEITLDDEPVSFGWARRMSLAAIRCHLEMLALRRSRVLVSLLLDGALVDLTQTSRALVEAQQIVAATVGLNELGLRLSTAAHEELTVLRAHVEQTALLVLINTRRKAQQLWWELVPALKSPLLSLAFLLQMYPVANVEAARATLTRHSSALAEVIDDIEQFCGEFDTVVLSDALQERIEPWLQQTGRLLQHWYGVPA